MKAHKKVRRQPRRPGLAPVSAEFPIELLRKVDEEAARAGVSRSDVLRWAVTERYQHPKVAP